MVKLKFIILSKLVCWLRDSFFTTYPRANSFMLNANQNGYTNASFQVFGLTRPGFARLKITFQFWSEEIPFRLNFSRRVVLVGLVGLVLSLPSS